MNHVGLATKDIDATIAFYRDVLGFSVVRYDRITITEGGTIRHLFMDMGAGQTISFVGPEKVPNVPSWDAGINAGLGVPRGFYHFAFHCENVKELMERQADLIQKNVVVSPVLDHDWCKSIYFDDPVNGLSLEFTAYTRAFNEDDRTLSTRFSASIGTFNYEMDEMKLSEADRFKILAAREAKQLAETGAQAASDVGTRSPSTLHP
jgi:catechol 2,3-dioxygenase-like lactoylglutathione lyase family enzyme